MVQNPALQARMTPAAQTDGSASGGSVLDQLVSARAFTYLQESLGHLSDADSAGFECHLAVRAPSADSQLCFERPRSAAAARGRLRAASESGSEHPAWRRLRAFDALWADPASAVHQGVNRLWLEFDVSVDPSTPHRAPVPNVFFDLHQASDVSATINQGIAALQDAALPDDVARTLAATLAALPGGARPTWVGLMLARPAGSLRLCVAEVPRAQAVEYLEQLGWRDPTGGLPALLSTIQDSLDGGRIVLQLAIGPEVAPRLGLECFLDRPSGSRPGDWDALLAYLVRAGRCVPEKRRALWNSKGWCYYERPKPTIYGWTMSHVKVVYQAGAVVDAKAYFYFGSIGSDQESRGTTAGR